MSKQEEIKQALAGFLKQEDNHLLINAPEYISYLLEQVEQSESEAQSLRRSLTSEAVKNASHNVDNMRLRKELEEKENHIKEIKTEKAILEGELSQANAYKHFEAERTKEAVQLHKELEAERKQAAAVRKAMQDVLYYLQRDSYIPAQDILEQYLAMSVGQEGEGNHE
ncbi:hypothetical protein Q9R46_14690 [Paenibacillus sp. RRE4]|uniref:hypothetical protein n=1 Tax=Paenibacillus sp. RRE4 TaxID=2962587 RepID=UPI0028815917|nr:hypothetical protein [Paenibacillus sp. RRE4]MDT0123906.1 hypothetical protein [Paenibacillus sp. RRE4]